MRLTASVAVYSDARREVWSVGDCRLRLGDTVFMPEKAVDVRLAGKRAAAIEAYLAQGGSPDALRVHDVGRMAIASELREPSLSAQNNPKLPEAYGVIDGFTPYAADVHCYRVEPEARWSCRLTVILCRCLPCRLPNTTSVRFFATTRSVSVATSRPRDGMTVACRSTTGPMCVCGSTRRLMRRRCKCFRPVGKAIRQLLHAPVGRRQRLKMGNEAGRAGKQKIISGGENG